MPNMEELSAIVVDIAFGMHRDNHREFASSRLRVNNDIVHTL